MSTFYLCNIYAGLKNNRLYTLSQIDRFQWSKTQHGHPVNKLLLNANRPILMYQNSRLNSRHHLKVVGNDCYDLYDFISQSLQLMPLFRTEFKYIEIGLLCNQQYLELSLTINGNKIHTMCKFIVSLLSQFINSHFQP